MRLQWFLPVALFLTVAALGLMWKGLPATPPPTPAPPEPEPQVQRQVSATGEARVLAAPDTARITFTIVMEGVSAREVGALERVLAGRMDDVVAALRELELPSVRIWSDLVRLDAGPDPMGTVRTSRYRAEGRVHLVLGGVENVDRAIAAGVAAGADRAETVGYWLADAGALRDHAVRMATRDAMDRAQAAVAAAGAKAQQLLSLQVEVEESTAGSVIPLPGSPTPGDVWVRARVTAVYSL